jgi:hypothetical protein
MREKATLKLDDGAELGVELDSQDLDREEIMRRASDNGVATADSGLIAVIDELLATATRHPAGTTNRMLEADRERPN